MTVKELLCRIDSRELTEWQVYANLEPFGEERADLRMATLAALLAEINRDRTRNKKPFTPEDFMPRFGPPVVPEPEPETLLNKMTTWQAVLGAAAS